MNKKKLGALLSVAALAGTGLAFVAAPAFAGERGHDRCVVAEPDGYTWDVQTYQEVEPAGPSTFAAHFDTDKTRATGHYEVVDVEGGKGLRIWTEGNTNTGPNGNGGVWNTDKVSLYRSVSIPLADITSVSLNYAPTFGITPGSQLVVDIDGDGAGDGILVGEPVYGDNFWLSEGTDAFKAFDPSGDENGGNGSEWFGTLAQWTEEVPLAKVVGIGFSLGSGVHGDGVLTGITINKTVYPFVKTVEGPAAVYDWVTTGHGEGAEAPLGAPGKTKIVNVQPRVKYTDQDCDYKQVTSSIVPGDCKTKVDVETTTTIEWIKGEKVQVGPYKWAYLLTKGEPRETKKDLPWTQDRKDECVKPTPTPTPSNTATPTPVPASNSGGGLANTGGGDVNPLLPIAGGLVVAIGACLAALGFLRRRANV